MTAVAHAALPDAGRPRRGIGGRPPKLSREQCRDMARRFLNGEHPPDLAVAFGVSPALAYAICAVAAAMEG